MEERHASVGGGTVTLATRSGGLVLDASGHWGRRSARFAPGQDDEARRALLSLAVLADDPQVQRVYDWEWGDLAERNKEVMGREDCVHAVGEACRMIGLPPPEIRFTNSRVSCKAYPNEWAMQIAVWGRDRLTLLHETAHLADFRQGAGRWEPHGPTFVRWAMDLYRLLIGIPENVLERTAARRGLRVAPRWAAGTEKIMEAAARAGSDFFSEDF
jgi:hypothetical protein